MSLFTNTINYTKSAIVTAFALCAAAMSSFAQRPSMLPTRTLLIEKDTVKFNLNFDDTTTEPETLPGRYPNLLVNGATGISAGYATNIPPHNLSEVIEATIYKIDHPNMSIDDFNGMALDQGINLSKSELDFSYNFIKDNWLDVFNDYDSFDFSKYNLCSIGTVFNNIRGVISVTPYINLIPQIFMCILMLCYNVIGNGLRDAINPSADAR